MKIMTVITSMHYDSLCVIQCATLKEHTMQYFIKSTRLLPCFTNGKTKIQKLNTWLKVIEQVRRGAEIQISYS